MITKEHYLQNYNSFIVDLVNAPECLQVQFLKNVPFRFKYIKNKTLYVKELYRVYKDCNYFKKMKNLNKQQIKDCVEVNINVLKFIKNPSFELLAIAIKKDFRSVSYIKCFKNINYETLLKLIRLDGRILLFLNNTTNEEIEIAFESVEYNPIHVEAICKKHKIKINDEKALDYYIKSDKRIDYLKYVKRELTKEEQMSFVQDNINAIMFIKNQHEDVKNFISQAQWLDDKIIRYIENPSYEMQKKAIEKCAENIRYIKNPSEDLQLLAINKDSESFYDIKKPSRKVIELFFSKFGIKLGTFHEIKAHRGVCKNCNEICGYKFKDGIYDECPRFLEHVAMRG